MRIGLSERSSCHVTQTAANTRPSSVASAAPNTPMWNTKISTALPTMLMTFITRLAYMLMRLLPCARKSAAPALYMPMNG